MSKESYGETLAIVEAQGSWDVGLTETQVAEYENQLVPEGYSVTDWEQDEGVLSSFEVLTDYLAENQSVARYAIDQASTGQTDDPAEYMRDLTARIGAPLSLAASLKDAPEEVKAAYRNMKSRWDKASITGVGEVADAVLDYGTDVVASPEGLATIGGLLSGTVSFGAGTAVTIATRKAAQLAGQNALTKAVKASYAATAKNPLTASTLIGTGHGLVAGHLMQELDISADIKGEEDYSAAETLIGGAIGGTLGFGIAKGIGLYANSKVGNQVFRESTESRKELSIPEGSKAYDEAIEGEWMPASSGDVLDEAMRLEGRTATTVDGADNAGARTYDSEAMDTAAQKFTDDIGGGEKTKAEVLARIRAAAANEPTAEGRANAIKQGLYTIASDITGNFYGKAAGVLSPITKFSGTAAQLQKKLSHEFGIKYKVQDEVVAKDLSEVQREVTGKVNERFRAIVEKLSLSEIDTKFASEINAALSKNLRSSKPVKYEYFDDATNAAINKASLEIKELYNEMGIDLSKIKVIDKLKGNYVPRQWNRRAIEENQDELVELFKTKANMSPAAARRTVKNMLDVKNQVDAGGGGGHFFSAKRKINTIGDDADFEKFLNNDVLGTLHAYTFQYGKSIAKHRVLGVRNYDDFRGFYINRIKEEMTEAGETFTPKIERQIEKLYRTATGEGMERYGHKTQVAVDTYSFASRVALLGMATLSSLTEVFLNVGKAGVRNSIKGFGEAIEQSHNRVTKNLESDLMTNHGLNAKEALTEMRNFSLHVDQALAQVGDRLAGDELMTVGLQNASNKFFRLNMLDQWTKFVQNVSHSSGKNLVNENIEKLAVRYKNQPMDKAGEVLAGELAELGIDAKKAVSWFNAGAKRTDDFYKNDFLGGVARYTNSVVLQPTAMSGLKPLLFSNPKTAVFFQLLSYPAAFTNTVLKGAAKSLIKAPTRNAGKLAAAGLIMTGMARWTNYARTGGESERGKSLDEIYGAAIARWGGNGLLLDSFQRAQTATKYTKSNLSYAAMPFGPAVSDGISLIQQGIIPTIGYKVPLLSGSYFGKQILGERTVDRYRKGLREAQTDVFGGLIETFDEQPKAVSFNVGGSVAAKIAPSIVSLFQKKGHEALEESLPIALSGDVAGTITSSTKGLLDFNYVRDTADKLEGSISLRLNEGDIALDADTAAELAEANIATMFNSRKGTLEDAENSVNFKKALDETDPIKAQENLSAYQKELGYTDDQLFALQTIDEIEDLNGSKETIKGSVFQDLKEIKEAYDSVNIEVSDADRYKAKEALFDEDSLDATHEILTQFVKNEQPLVSEAGAPIIARDAIIKIAANGKVNFNKFKAPKINPDKKPDASLSEAEREAALQEHLKDSFEKKSVFRTISTFKDREYNISFVFSREVGMHAGTRGVAKTIQFRDAVFDVYDGEKAGDTYRGFKDKRLQQDSYEDELKRLEQVAKLKDKKITPTETQEGYISVKNPLLYRGETAVDTWAADKILSETDGTNELFLNIKKSGGKITEDTKASLRGLRERAIALQQEPTGNIVDILEHQLMKNELTIDFREMLKGLGFDSIKYVNEIEYGFKKESKYSYILFDPEQFKLTTSAAFDSTDPRQAYVTGSIVRGVQKAFAPKKASGLYSEAQKAAQQLQGKKPRAGQSFLNEMKDVTPDELNWMGATERFGNDKLATKEEVQGFFEENDFDFEVQVGRSRPEEIETVDDMPTLTGNEDEEIALFENWLDENKPFEREMMDDLLDEDPDAWDEMYVELMDEWQESTGGMGDFATQKAHLDYSFEGTNTKNYRELVISIPDKYKKVDLDYQHTMHHPASKNQIAHVRLADIDQADDAFTKTLLVDEIQSDAHQTAGGKEGAGYLTKEKANAKALKQQEIETRRQEINKNSNPVYAESLNLTNKKEEGFDLSASEEARLKELELEINKYDEQRNQLLTDAQDSGVIFDTGDVPDLPLKKDKQWGAVGLRQAMKVAAEEGYDQVALTTGRLQAERNRKVGDISEAIFYKQTGKDSTGWSVQGIRNDEDGMGDFLVNFDSYEDGVEKLPKLIGKENAGKLLATTPDDLGDYALVQPMTFKRGGQKYMDFYDGTLQKIWKRDFAKKYGVDIKMVKYDRNDKVVELPTLTITDKMREDINRGLKMFAEGGYVVESGDTLSAISRREGLSVSEIAKMNDIKDVNKIYAGQTLRFEPKAEEAIALKAEQVKEAEPIVAEPKESILTKVSGAQADVTESITETLGGVKENITETFDEAKESVTSGVSKTLSALRKMVSTDFSSKGRTAESTAGTTEAPRPTSLMGDMTMEQVREANAPEAPDLSDTKLPDLDFSSEGRTAENTTNAVSTEDFEIKLPKLDIEGIREAVSTPDPDLSNTPRLIRNIQRKVVAGINVVPENALLYVRYMLGNKLGLDSQGTDVRVEKFGTEQQDVLRAAVENAIKDGRTSIKYSDYPDMRNGERPDQFYKAKRNNKSYVDLAVTSLKDPVFEMFTTTGVFNFKNLGEGKYEIIPDKYDFEKAKSGGENRKEAIDDYGKLTHAAQDISADPSKKYTFNVRGVLI